MKNRIPYHIARYSLRLLMLTAIIAGILPVADACTSALVGAERGANGRWLLWKHRDSGHPDNYVRAFAATDSTLAYVALYNAADTASREAWIGFNQSGFAVMNTATYNIPSPRKEWQDREGLVMTEALRRCRTVADFQQLLTGYDGPLGVQANFGVFDAEGNGAYFETSDTHLKIFMMDSTGILTRTNYSLSGTNQKRLGLSRHKAENHLIDSLLAIDRPYSPAGRLAAEDFIETLSRSLYLPAKGVDLLDGSATSYPDDGDVICRRSSCSSVVIEGPLPGEDPASTMIMWTAIGFPTLSVVEAVTLDSIPAGLRYPSSAVSEANALRDRAILPSGKSANGKQRYRFNLPMLRREIPRRRSISTERYAPARSRREAHPDRPTAAE